MKPSKGHQKEDKKVKGVGNHTSSRADQEKAKFKHSKSRSLRRSCTLHLPTIMGNTGSLLLRA